MLTGFLELAHVQRQQSRRSEQRRRRVRAELLPRQVHGDSRRALSGWPAVALGQTAGMCLIPSRSVTGKLCFGIAAAANRFITDPATSLPWILQACMFVGQQCTTGVVFHPQASCGKGCRAYDLHRLHTKVLFFFVSMGQKNPGQKTQLRNCGCGVIFKPKLPTAHTRSCASFVAHPHATGPCIPHTARTRASVFSCVRS